MPHQDEIRIYGPGNTHDTGARFELVLKIFSFSYHRHAALQDDFISVLRFHKKIGRGFVNIFAIPDQLKTFVVRMEFSVDRIGSMIYRLPSVRCKVILCK